jgi:hypothetical protein
MDMPLMKCGCVAQSYRTATGGVKIDPPQPSCVVHNCIEIADKKPSLAGRMAKCSYSHSNPARYKQHGPVPSSYDLAFFQYNGPGSQRAEETCVCGYTRVAHYPRWRASIKYAQRWYKIERREGVRNVESHQPDENAAHEWANDQVRIWMNWTNNPETKVLEAELISVVKIPSPLKCREFKAHGPYEFDRFYCGCHGWD